MVELLLADSSRGNGDGCCIGEMTVSIVEIGKAVFEVMEQLGESFQVVWPAGLKFLGGCLVDRSAEFVVSFNSAQSIVLLVFHAGDDAWQVGMSNRSASMAKPAGRGFKHSAFDGLKHGDFVAKVAPLRDLFVKFRWVKLVQARGDVFDG